MGKNKDIDELTTLLAISLSHKIGSIVNKNEIYAEKYSKESENFLKKAVKVSLRKNWNEYDKELIKKELEKKLKDKLKERDFLKEDKFDFINVEVYKVLKELELDGY